MIIKSELNANSLIAAMRDFFLTVIDQRSSNRSISLADALMCGFAMFSLKEKSLLSFEDNIEQYSPNLQTVYGIDKIPTDTNLRTMLDPISTEALRPAFKIIFNRLQRSNLLNEFSYLNDHYLVSIDGTEFFSSNQIKCANCMERKYKDGTALYYHQFLGAAIVHPDKREVIPLVPEMIVKQDGQAKNDCERNASKRFLDSFRKDHPKLKVIIIEDGLSSNAPHIKDLTKHNCRYILGAKPDDHKFLFAQVAEMKSHGKGSEFSIEQGDITHLFSFCNDLPLNETNQDVRINFLEYCEINNKTNKKQHFTWVTDFNITQKNVYALMRGGRARWKIENETFNTLKNQGYHIEHNFGHGYNNLCSIFALLMMLAFLVDQSLQISCNLFNEAMKKCKSRTNFWHIVRCYFVGHIFESMNEIYDAIVYGIQKQKPSILYIKSG